MKSFQRKTGMNYLKTIFFSAGLSCLLMENAFCQSAELKDLQKSFDHYQQQHLTEKLFVQTDRTFYMAGEIIWFKVYNVEAGNHQLLDLSKVAYVEITDKNQKPVLQAKVGLKNGTGSGSFYLPFSSSSGNFKLRAYTSWMKNFGPEYFYEKNITIVNPTRKLAWKPEADTSQYDVHFFPEGGNLVYGLPAKLAFKATDRYGKGIAFSGWILNQQNDTIARFRPLKFGMGSLSFTPIKGNRYSAVVKPPDGRSLHIELPEVYEKGYVMQVKTMPDQRISVTVNAIGDFADPHCFLVVYNRQNIRLAQTLQLKENKATWMISKDDLEEGISCFTLFNDRQQPVCERLYFKKPQSALNIDANTDKNEYATRKKVEVDISALSASANLSVSVYRMDSLQTLDENNIFTYWWLNSELKGKVESPEYYFQPDDGMAEEAADNLMLTQGWRRYRWEDILKDQSPLFEYAPEKEGHIILGRVVNRKTGDPAGGIGTYLSVPAKKFILAAAVSNEEGLLKFDVKDFYGTDEIVVQTANTADSIYRIDLLNPFSEKYADSKMPFFHPDRNSVNPLVTNGIHSQVQQVFSGAELQKFDAYETADSTAFYGKPDQKYFLDDYTRFTTMEEVMREYIADITVRKHEVHFRFRVFNYPYKMFFDLDPVVLIDGVPLADANKIMAFDPLKIKKIELVNRKYFLGPMVMDGIISYSTYNGDLGGFQFDPNVFILKYEGLQLQREFYAPRYETQQQEQSRLPDFRNLLLWMPQLITEGQHKKHLSFYTSDAKGKYIMVVQGVAADGKAGFKTLNFSVK